MGSEEEVDKEVGIKNTKMENNDKNEKKRKHEEEDGEKSSKKLSKEDRKALKAQQKAEKAAALEKVPRKDENGAYVLNNLLYACVERNQLMNHNHICV